MNWLSFIDVPPDESWLKDSPIHLSAHKTLSNKMLYMKMRDKRCLAVKIANMRQNATCQHQKVAKRSTKGGLPACKRQPFTS